MSATYEKMAYHDIIVKYCNPDEESAFERQLRCETLPKKGADQTHAVSPAVITIAIAR